MIEISERTTMIDPAQALRDLADRLEAGGPGESVVCVIGRGTGATLYVLGGGIAESLTATAELLSGIVEALPMMTKATH